MYGLRYSPCLRERRINTSPNPRAFSRGEYSCHVTVLKTGKAKSGDGYANPVAKLLFGDAVQTYA